MRSLQKGQGLTEYIILVGIIAVGSLFLVSKLGESIKSTTGNIINVLTGQSSEHHKTMNPIDTAYMGRTDLWQSIRKRPRSNSSQ